MKRGKILIVDDHAGTLEFLSFFLSSEGYEILPLADPREVIVQAPAFQPDVLIIDLWMPGMTGLKLHRELGKVESMKKVPVIFLATDGDEYLTWSHTYASPVEYLLRPVSGAAIKRMVGTLMARNDAMKAT
ncbi:MAG TPA: response regulator [Bacteroidia bacterium]